MSDINQNDNEAAIILANQKYCTISVCSLDAKPWITPVFYATDEKLNLFWLSENSAKHSSLLETNSLASLVIYDSNASMGAGNALYMSGKVCISPESLTDNALSLLREKVGSSSEFSDRYTREDVSGESPWRLYALTPSQAWCLDRSSNVRGWPVVRRVELNLELLRTVCK